MKKAFDWCISIVGAVCIVFMIGVFVGRRSIEAPIKTNQTAQSTAESTTISPSSHKININTADITLLQSLPGIGEVLAQRIIDYRDTHGPFTDIRQISMIEGIGEGKMMNILPLICIEDE